ncbi:MAG: NAD(P)-dependent oxidoreductase [bacterium]|nr:NAD(P)-dependent oxidoreductase [bacterium]
MKRVLITGANGFTGGTLVQALLKDQDLEIFPMVRRLCGLANEREVELGTITLPLALMNLPKMDVIVHLGARVGWGHHKRSDLFLPNVLATAQLMDYARLSRAYCIFASAALIAGTSNPHITRKSGLDLQTKNDYLYSKWLGEQVIDMSGVPYGILRISGIFGKNGPIHLGLNRTIKDALKGVPPTLFGNGKIKRNYIYVKDLCNIIHWCIHNPIEGTHLVAGSETNTITEMLDTVCKVMLPGKSTEIRPGAKGRHQIIEPSPLLPRGRTFEEAIKDILEN